MNPLRWLAVPLLAGCTAPPPPVAAQACTLQKVAEIPVGFVRGVVSAPATIDDKPVTLLIDTGSESSIVTPVAVDMLRLSATRTGTPRSTAPAAR